MNKKLLCILLTLCLCVLLTGCLNLDIEAGVDAQHNAYLRYTAVYSTEGYSVENRVVFERATERVSARYEKMSGFTVSSAVSDDRMVTLVIERIVPAESYGAAFEELKTLLTDPQVTPFLEADFSPFSADAEAAAEFRGMIDLSKLIAAMQLDSLPPDVAEPMERVIRESEVHLTVTLPATEVLSHAGGELTQAGGLAALSAELSLDGPTEIALSTRANLIDGAISPETAADTLARLSRDRALAVAGAAALVLIAVIALVSLLRRRRGSRRRRLRDMPPEAADAIPSEAAAAEEA